MGNGEKKKQKKHTLTTLRPNATQVLGIASRLERPNRLLNLFETRKSAACMLVERHFASRGLRAHVGCVLQEVPCIRHQRPVLERRELRRAVRAKHCILDHREYAETPAQRNCGWQRMLGRRCHKRRLQWPVKTKILLHSYLGIPMDKEGCLT